MPVGPFKTFDDCVRAQRAKGNNMDSARKICGEIEKRSQSKESSQDWRHLEFVAPIHEFHQQQASDGNGDFMIRGTAINETTTRNGITYMAEELQKAAPSFRDKPILKDHTNSVESIVGRTTQNVNFDSIGRNIQFEARIVDSKMKKMIQQGLITSVSIGAMVHELDEVEVEESSDSEVTTKVIARGIEGVEISLVAVPADKNAGFAQAMAESFKLKSRSQDLQEKPKEETTMAEEVSALEALKIEREKLEENIATLRVEKLKQEKEILEKQLVKEEAEEPAAEEAAEEPVAAEEVAAEEAPVEEAEAESAAEEPAAEEKVNKTKGIVKEEKVEVKKDNAVFERSQLGRGYDYYHTSYDASKFKRLSR